ncbi:MAG: protein kinase, partial [Dehalococcoidia bacterium]|nr:protein kinase [Dehalococcoidia bacterium]
MRCSSCGRENPDDASFCNACGSPLAPSCPGCGRTSPHGSSFCNRCGTQLAPPGPSAAAPAPEPAPALPASFAGGRYQVQRFLGEGAKKRVYLARDSRLEREVALAVIKTEGLDVEGLIRVRREAQAMGRLGSHPHVVTVHDIGEEDGQPFIVMEHMSGGSLEDQLRRAENRRLPSEDVLRIAGQVCQALEHAHGTGIVHRDVKPGNIWFGQDGTAKLGDLGLAVAIDRSRLTQEGMMVGTALYMSPEQALGGEITARADLYSFGCVLYETVAGRPPFFADDIVAVISQHLNTQPIAPSWHSPDCPPALEALVLRLLEKDPTQRPASAAEVKQALDAIDVVAPAVAPEPAAEASYEQHRPLYRRTFVGRERELDALKSAFDGALSGEGQLAMVVGEPGIGKTTVCEQLATYAALRGGRALVGHSYEEGSLTLPYLPFVEVMRSYVLNRDVEALRDELGSGAAEVARIVSEIRDCIDIEPVPARDPEEERYRLLHAVTTFLHNAASVQPLCIILEDLHDADHATLDLLTHLARNLAGARLLIVGTYRDVEVDRAHPLSPALVELRRSAGFQRIPLRGLTADEVQRMLSGIVQQDVAWELSEAVYRQTEGHPLFVQEVVRYASEGGFIVRSGGQWQQTSQEPLTAFMPEGLRDVIGKRLSRLSDECDALLSVAAVIGREFPLQTLRAVGGMEEEQLVGGLEEAMRLGILEERSQVGDVRYRFAHAFFRQTLYEEMIA